MEIESVLSRVLNWIFLVFLIGFSLLIVFQIIKKIFGGSWSSEGLAIALLVLVIGLLFNLGAKFAKMEVKFTRLEMSFMHLAKDFKEHLAMN